MSPPRTPSGSVMLVQQSPTGGVLQQVPGRPQPSIVIPVPTECKQVAPGTFQLAASTPTTAKGVLLTREDGVMRTDRVPTTPHSNAGVLHRAQQNQNPGRRILTTLQSLKPF
eukprot:CAMPEP_0204360726 /NCGR_PEP_ID=MMETSP0469-20131031/38270_1 /ASSEMBLY_ACC=CAM_ASM_000384 /TAXON_ID=2969 /ORGANISM="Oxyrrhis marina" /LENGTH=111 /DNA_ID=CAMNT_0051349003 /DNA_START=72 /DNA_END=407 /DNA_ORIENTATION=-